MGVFRPAPDDPRVTLRLQPNARWVAEQYPTESLATNDDGTVDVTIAVTAAAWLERLLVRLGRDAQVLTAPSELAGAGARAATGSCLATAPTDRSRRPRGRTTRVRRRYPSR